MADQGFPHSDSPVVDPSTGIFTFNWYNYFAQAGANAVTSSDLPAGIESWLDGLPTSAPSGSKQYWWDSVANTLKRTP